jgi:hypothetical protein
MGDGLIKKTVLILCFVTGMIVGHFLPIGTVISVDPSSSPNYYLVRDGYVPDAKTALKIAKAVWEPIYGKKNRYVLVSRSIG